MALIASGSNKDFKPVPEGNHTARCYHIVDLGTQESTYDGESRLAHKVMICWELNGEADDGSPLASDDGKPFTVNKQYTMSLGKKATLRADLESWRGQAFTDDELKGFDISKLLGVYCMVTVKHDKKDDKTYVNVASVSRWPAALKNNKFEPYYPGQIFDIDSRDMGVFDALPEWMQDKIKSSLEWTGKSKAEAAPSRGHADADIPETDDIPF